jgi:hypothetical protein
VLTLTQYVSKRIGYQSKVTLMGARAGGISDADQPVMLPRRSASNGKARGSMNICVESVWQYERCLP